ncbi:MAG: CRISPR-associated helicase Cas3' [Burkholderiales bacterium]|nr:CRISPR-associated helicase Cas3' [Burkholderiales bacterium]
MSLGYGNIGCMPHPIQPDNAPQEYFAYWGKARPQEGAAELHLLAYHALDVAAVGRVYLQHAPALMGWLREQFRVSGPALLDWLTFWLALHDLGKFSVGFQGQRADLVERLQGAPCIHRAPANVRHDSLGMHVWLEHVQPRAEQQGWFGSDLDYFDGITYWARAVTGHHGQPPLSEVRFMAEHFRPRDVSAVHSFVDAMRELLLTLAAAGVPQSHDAVRFLKLSQELSWWVAGLAVLADWIGSNSNVFTYRDEPAVSIEDYWNEALALAELALRHSGVVPVGRQTSLSFAELFPAIARPSPLQRWAASVSLSPGPQIHLLEDVTGAGKTEAAITLTHRLLAAGCADGFFIGLPTMATANAMYGRIADVYRLLFDGDASLVLAHGRKTLVEDFAATVIEPGQEEHDSRQHDESATSRCTRWLADHNKRALLSPAGVGTVDQALLGALQSKHQSLRLLGLVRKVLVVDEVHACDAYMQRTLEVLLRFHARAGGSAILLSATMPERMKTALLKAFAAGCQQSTPGLGSEAYPLATSWSAATPAAVAEVAIDTRADVRRRVCVRYETQIDAVIAGIVAALAAGQCVAWIRNTIADALDARTALATQVAADRITLFHARFALGDRLDIEEAVLAAFGPESGPEQRRGRLLIATQVAEQSLDVDFDLVVSDLAPVDRIIQRAGRLRRHVRDVQGRRMVRPGATDERGEPWLWVLGPAWTDTPAANWFKQMFPKAAAVYPHHGQLWLTAGELRSGTFTMPDDARRLVETVFADEATLPAGLQGNANRVEGAAYGDASLADMNSVKLNKGYARDGIEWSADTVTPSRLGEDTMDVLLGRWHGDELRPWRDDKPLRHQWTYSAVRVARRLIASAVPPSSPVRAAAVEAALEAMPGGGKWVVMLALDESTGIPLVQAQAATKDDSPAKITVWRYDTAMGLRAELPALPENE